MGVINNIPIYITTEEVYEYFRKNTKKGKSISKNTLEKKLSALIFSTTDCRNIKNMDCAKSYRFGNFIMTLNEKTNTIIRIRWITNTKEKYNVMSYQSKLLKESYEKLGLSRTGNSLKCEYIISRNDTNKLKDLNNIDLSKNNRAINIIRKIFRYLGGK